MSQCPHCASSEQQAKAGHIYTGSHATGAAPVPASARQTRNRLATGKKSSAGLTHRNSFALLPAASAAAKSAYNLPSQGGCMRLRTFLSLTVLTAALLFTLLTENPTNARECPWDMCVSLYDECQASCNGYRQCIKACERDTPNASVPTAACVLSTTPRRPNLTGGRRATVNGDVSPAPANAHIRRGRAGTFTRSAVEGAGQ